MVFIDQRGPVLDFIFFFLFFFFGEVNPQKPTPGFLIAGQRDGERQGWLARGEFGFTVIDISLNEALSGAGSVRGRGSGEAKTASSLKTTSKNLFYLLFTFCAAFRHVSASHCTFLGFKT